MSFENREFTTAIHMGHGEHSLGRVYLLSRRLDRAFEMLCGVQQPCHCSHNCDCKKENLFYREQIDIIVQDIAMALTGKEWIPNNEKS